MAISNYLQKCDYRIGGLKPYIYLIHKDALKLNFKAKGVEVSFKKTKDGDIYKVNGAMCVFNQEETYHNKYRFNNTLEVTINEQYKEPFFYGLRTLRTNEYYIIVEDKKGVQYLINAELYTNLNYEYNFSDTANVQNAVLLTWNNLSNYPLLIMEERIETDKLLLGEECPYNLGQAFSLIMTHHNDLKTKDDGVKATEIYIDDVDKIKRIEYLKESFTLNETYDGNMFRVTLTYSIPLDDNQFNWHYNLLEFEKNRYTAVLRTTNDNYIIAGIEKGLFPKYSIQTSEDDETPNMINITFEQLSQYPIIFTDDITQYRWIDDAPMCFGYDRYQMLVQQYSEDWGETWETTEPIVKKKGDLIEKDSSYCKQYQWVDDGTYCKEITTEYIQWRETTLFVCEDGNKYEKLQKYSSTDGKTYSPQDEYIKGDLIEENSKECSYVAIRWVDNGYICYPVNEELTRWDITGTQCSGTTLYNTTKELVTNNGSNYYESGVNKLGDIVKENCCACGYVNTEYRFDSTVCSTAITESNPPILGNGTFEITSTSGNWTREGNTFTSNKISNSETTVQRIYFKTNSGGIKFTIDQSSENCCDYLIIGNLDKRVTNSTSTGSSYNYYNHRNKTTGTTSMTINDTNEHFIELMYRKDGSVSEGRDNVIVTLGVETLSLQPYSKYDKYYLWEYCTDEYDTINRKTEQYIYYVNEINSCDCEWTGTTWQWDGEETICGSNIEGLDSTSEYEVWRETDCNNFTGNVDYRNPKKSCKCGYREYDWDSIDINGEGYEYICGSAIGDSYDSTSKYEVWREYAYCPTDDTIKEYTGNIEYRNPQKSYDCNWITYQWREDEDNVCGNALPENTTEVDEAPQLNTDFE